MQFFKLLKNQFGVNLVEVMAATGVVSVLVYTSSSFYSQYKQSESVAKYRETAANLRHMVLAMLSSEEAWELTINGNSGMDCLRQNSSTYCTNKASLNPIKVFTSSGKYQTEDGTEVTGPIIDDSPSWGFTRNGTPCNSFVMPPNPGNDQCPIRVEVRWTAACSQLRPQDNTTCKITQSLLDAEFYFNSSNQVMNSTMNITRFNFRHAPRMTFEAESPTSICSARSEIYAPIIPAVINPNSNVVDPEGCVDPSVF